jgi:hypothetical protein
MTGGFLAASSREETSSRCLMIRFAIAAESGLDTFVNQLASEISESLTS